MEAHYRPHLIPGLGLVDLGSIGLWELAPKERASQTSHCHSSMDRKLFLNYFGRFLHLSKAEKIQAQYCDYCICGSVQQSSSI